MIRAGGHAPGFGPFIRPAVRLGEEHTSWGSGTYRKGEPVFVELSGCVSRYHAPLGRLVHIGGIKDEDAAMADVTARAFGAVVKAMRHGIKARESMPRGRRSSTRPGFCITAVITAAIWSALASRRPGPAAIR